VREDGMEPQRWAMNICGFEGNYKCNKLMGDQLGGSGGDIETGRALASLEDKTREKGEGYGRESFQGILRLN